MIIKAANPRNFEDWVIDDLETAKDLTEEEQMIIYYPGYKRLAIATFVTALQDAVAPQPYFKKAKSRHRFLKRRSSANNWLFVVGLRWILLCDYRITKDGLINLIRTCKRDPNFIKTIKSSLLY